MRKEPINPTQFVSNRLPAEIQLPVAYSHTNTSSQNHAIPIQIDRTRTTAQGDGNRYQDVSQTNKQAVVKPIPKQIQSIELLIDAIEPISAPKKGTTKQGQQHKPAFDNLRSGKETVDNRTRDFRYNTQPEKQILVDREETRNETFAKATNKQTADNRNRILQIDTDRTSEEILFHPTQRESKPSAVVPRNTMDT